MKSPVDSPVCNYMDQLVDQLRATVPLALGGWDEDAIHDARVATRRLKATLDVLAACLSPQRSKPFQRVLKKLRRMLGPLRDLDVMLGHLEEPALKARYAAGVAWLSEHLRRQRQSARTDAAAKTTAAEMLARIGTWWGLRDEVNAAGPAIDSLLMASLAAQWREFSEKAGRLVQDSGAGVQGGDPHALRISGKLLRYTLDLAGESGHPAPRPVMRTFKKFQDALGLWHDYLVLSERAIRAALDEQPGLHDPALYGQVLEILGRGACDRAARQLKRFSDLWTKHGATIRLQIQALARAADPQENAPAALNVATAQPPAPSGQKQTQGVT